MKHRHVLETVCCIVAVSAAIYGCGGGTNELKGDTSNYKSVGESCVGYL